MTGVRAADAGPRARAALEQLLAGPQQPATDTAIPRRRRARGRRDRERHRDGELLARSSARRRAPPRARSSARSTQFPSVRAVRSRSTGSRWRSRTAPATTSPGPRRPADYADLTPDALIFVRTPDRDSTVTSPVDVEGTADRLRGDAPAGDLERRQARRHEDDHGQQRRPRARHVVAAAHAPEGRRQAAPLRAVGRGRLAPARDGGPAARAVAPTNGQWEPPPNRGYNSRADRSPVAQLAERSAVNRNVVGSSPTRGAQGKRESGNPEPYTRVRSAGAPRKQGWSYPVDRDLIAHRRESAASADAAPPRRRARTIAPAELLARVEHNTRAPYLIRWLLHGHLAEQTPAGLIAAAKTRELAAGLG